MDFNLNKQFKFLDYIYILIKYINYVYNIKYLFLIYKNKVLGFLIKISIVNF